MIPHVLHRIWLGPNPMPEEHVEFGETWKRFLPEWEHRLWTDADVNDGLLGPNAGVYERAESFVDAGHVGQLRADILRYAILLSEGGVYVDTDMEALRSIEPLIPGIKCFAAWEYPNKWINTAVMGAEPGSVFMAALADQLADRVLELARPGVVRPNTLTGPQFITMLAEEPALRPHLHVFPKGFFYPYLWNELDRGRESFPTAYAVHHWANMRRLKRRPR